MASLPKIHKNANYKKYTQSFAENEVTVFITAVINSPVDLSDVEILLFEVNGHANNSGLSIKTLNARFAEQSSSAALNNIQAIDLASTLEKEKYFALDDHLNGLGHLAIAEALISADIRGTTR